MRGNYPPGMGRRDMERAGIIDTRPPCPECDELIGDIDDHADECACRNMDRNDIVEDLEASRYDYDDYKESQYE